MYESVVHVHVNYFLSTRNKYIELLLSHFSILLEAYGRRFSGLAERLSSVDTLKMPGHFLLLAC